MARLLGLFGIALVLPGVGERRAIIGFTAGLIANVLIWQFAPGVSWLWWNVSGCVIALLVACAGGRVSLALPEAMPAPHRRVLLVGMAVLILAVCLLLPAMAHVLAGG